MEPKRDYKSLTYWQETLAGYVGSRRYNAWVNALESWGFTLIISGDGRSARYERVEQDGSIYRFWLRDNERVAGHGLPLGVHYAR